MLHHETTRDYMYVAIAATTYDTWNSKILFRTVKIKLWFIVQMKDDEILMKESYTEMRSLPVTVLQLVSVIM